MRLFLILLTFFSIIFSFSQEKKTIIIKQDTIKIENFSISALNFKILNESNKEIDTSKYAINYAKGILYLKDSLLINKEVTVFYQKLPSFLTKTYKAFNKELIVDNTQDLTRLYHTTNTQKNTSFKPFNGLETNGSISRGITLGNNQDGVLNSDFNLQLAGNLGKNVTVKAHISDNNIPIQDNGYTQRLNEFDKVFIELTNKKWLLTAGDIQFNNQEDYFLKFDKKVSGLSLKTILNHKNSKTDLYASAALVKGKFTAIDFNGQEANQGPYKITQTNESFLLLIFGSETVFVDGIPLERGKDKDYIIDYNSAEVTFNTRFPITSDMRIHIEFQVSDQNYNRFVSFNSANYHTKKIDLKLNLYSENDSKNSTLQQDLNDEHIEILANAGDNITAMVTQSAILENYTENKIQYKKELQSGVEIFVFSNNENEELYAVKFTYIGQNLGNYNIKENIATGRIYEYVGVNQGNYNPIFQLIAPNKLQIANLKFDYNPTNKIKIKSDFAYSLNDKNLFSNLDDANNNGFATKVNYQQLLIDKPWQLSTNLVFENIQQEFTTIQRIQNVEFKRDWNLENPLGNQTNFKGGFLYKKDSIGSFKYQFNRLEFSSNFKGTKQEISANYNYKKISFTSESSLLKSNSNTEKTDFVRSDNAIAYQLKKAWFGSKFAFENNKRIDKSTNKLTNLSQRFLTSDIYFGLGNKSKIFAEIGYAYRTNDSLNNVNLERVSNAHTYYVKSTLLQNKKSKLDLFANYRTVRNTNYTNEESLNTRLNYRQSLFNNILNFNTLYETSNGVLPQQDYKYIEVDVGKGYYTWIDYNNNNIQELEEFEVAQFQDQAIYLRVLLPSTKFIKTNRQQLKQRLNINFSKFSNQKGFKKGLSHFINQTNLTIDSKQKQDGDLLRINPFDFNTESNLALNYSFKNSLFFNRGKQHFSTTYAFNKLKNKTVFVTGNQENNILQHKLRFLHKFKKVWLLDLKGLKTNSKNIFETFVNRNVNLKGNKLETDISYIPNRSIKLTSFYHLKEKNNVIGNLETLKSNSLGLRFNYSKTQKMSLQTSFSMITNMFDGNLNSPIAFQLLEGLQDGRNFTWNLLLQKKITSYLDLNLNYNGRKSELSKIIHVGTVQLRANF